MTEDNTPKGQDPEEHPSEPPKRGSMRFQDESTTPREPSLAEQRARRQALIEEEQREAEDRQNTEIAARKTATKRKILIGSGVTVGLVGLVATYYAVAAPQNVTAVCTDSSGNVVHDQECDVNYVTSHRGYSSGGFLFVPIIGGGYNSYRYNYGGTGTVGGRVSGGTYTAPSNANVSTKSGTSVQRGGFGISGKTGTGSSGKSGGS
jgi:hypothetical protein